MRMGTVSDLYREAYVVTTVTLEDVWGDEADYEVGAYCSQAWDNYGGKERSCGVDVGDPDLSAPNCTLDESSLVDVDTLKPGWSERVEQALADTWERDQT